jgi:DNA-binding response OmpR family regulator
MSRILLVEDEPAIAETVAYALEDAGYAVDAVGSGDLALDAARGRDYDLMILDLMLPGIAGSCALTTGERLVEIPGGEGP